MAESADATEDIMEATYRALCRHGYADLTMQDIADESARSKAALHYHYDSKRSLLLAFLDHLLEHFETHVPDPEAVDPVEGLEAYLDAVLALPGEESGREFRTALLEIKAQAPYDEGFQDRLAQFDRSLQADLAALLAAGRESGVVREDVDPEERAHFLVTVLMGAGTREVAVGDTQAGTRRRLAAYVTESLLVDGEAVDL